MIQITPQTKVGELLEAYPDLEETLFALSPKFKHLKNPMLRKTVAKVATLQQAAQIAGISVEFLVNTLRKKMGLDTLNVADTSLNQNEIPDWINENQVTEQFDIGPLIESGQHPLNEVMKRLHTLPDGKIFKLIAPFYPAPLVDMAKERGFKVISKNNNDDTKVLIYFKKDK